jgi:hypothetical protein
MSNRIIIIIVATVLLLSLLFWLMQRHVVATSPERKESLCHTALFSNIKQLQYQAARQMRDFKTKTAVFSLIKKLNELDYQNQEDRQIGQEALASLYFLTGNKFGTDIEGSEYNYSWSPPAAEDRLFILYQINTWAIEKFSLDTLNHYAVKMSVTEENQLPQRETYQQEEYVEPPVEQQEEPPPEQIMETVADYSDSVVYDDGIDTVETEDTVVTTDTTYEENND